MTILPPSACQQPLESWITMCALKPGTAESWIEFLQTQPQNDDLIPKIKSLISIRKTLGYSFGLTLFNIGARIFSPPPPPPYSKLCTGLVAANVCHTTFFAKQLYDESVFLYHIVNTRLRPPQCNNT